MNSTIVYDRYLKMDLPKGQSAFLWGARKTGKSTYLKRYFPNSVFYDFLKSDIYLRFSKEPFLFREEVLALSQDQLQFPIIVDEVQKIPLLLDEVHWLIENTSAYFILCGSSARKLKKTGVNLLGGRAWRYSFYPLVYPEIKDFDLMRVLNYGTIPSHYTSSNPKKSLKAYIEDYLTQEIKSEGLVRNLPAFAKFLDSVGFSNGEMVSYTNIGRDCGVDTKTVKEYYQILIDTLLGYYLLPYQKKAKRNLILSTPKFYLFDVGVAGALTKRNINVLRDVISGKAFEQYVFLELIAHRGLNDLDHDICYWRTQSGVEVDFVLGDTVAIEVKITDHLHKDDFKGLVAFAKEYSIKNLYMVCLEPRSRKTTINDVEVLVLNYKEFLERLWSGQIIL